MKQTGYPRAVAVLRGGRDYPNIRGTVKFFQRCDGVLVEAEVRGLPRTQTGFFAFHIHEGGNCRGEGFPNSGGHFNPGSREHPNHAGDLPPLLGDFGKAYMKVLTGRFRVEEIIGKTVILHRNPDDFHTQPSGNAGEKIACGVIQRG
ncbi:MAG: superoxide dismutase family protein [Eubacteriales bacterium]|nr:superoxide dismutase family protein [Eubacteriales bacterium]